MKGFILQAMKAKKTYEVVFEFNFENFQIKTKKKDIGCVLEYSHHLDKQSPILYKSY